MQMLDMVGMLVVLDILEVYKWVAVIKTKVMMANQRLN